jgi:hypothetical protein
MYSSWAVKRRSKVIFWFSTVFLVVYGTYFAYKTYKPPTCFDGKENQDEIGVDCGGVCSLLCMSQIEPLGTVWTRSFQVSDTLWSALAYVENPNPEGQTEEAQYVFKLYDKSNTLIAERAGSTFVTQDLTLPIFEGRIDTGGKTPYRTEFDWVRSTPWYKVDGVYTVVLEEQELLNIDTKPELKATLVNKDPYNLKNIEIVAIVYDKDKNAIAASKTFVDSLSPRGKSNITFAWSRPFTGTPERWQLVARVPTQEIN